MQHTTQSAKVRVEGRKGAGAYNLAGYATSVSTDVTGGSLLGYQNSAWASADKVDASQTFDTATGTIKTNSGSYTWLILPETGINTKVTGELTNYKDDTSKSKSTRSSSQVGHIAGSFTSTAKSGTNTKTRTSNYGTTYDLNMQASKDSSSSSVSGILGYYVDGTKTWQGSPMTIQGGVNAAQSGDTINAAAGMYKENVAIDKSLAVKGAGAGTDPTKNTIVDGNQAGSVFTIGKTNPNVDVTLSGMTVQGGTGTIFTGENGWKYLAGGGILNYGTLTLDGISITGNKAIYGAGIHNLGTVTMNSGSSIKDNQGQRGGGIANVPGSTLTMNPGSSITGNTAFWGSGILNWGTVMMNSGSSITGNTASAGDGANGEGGGIYNAKTVIMNSGSSIACNTAEFGGGIFNVGYGITMNSGSSITSNKATSDGGGFYNYGGTLNMYVGSSITSNKAARYGGGICNTGTTDSGIGTVTFKDSAGNPVAYWPGYDSNADLYGFFTPHNTPNDIVDTPLTQS